MLCRRPAAASATTSSWQRRCCNRKRPHSLRRPPCLWSPARLLLPLLRRCCRRESGWRLSLLRRFALCSHPRSVQKPAQASSAEAFAILVLTLHDVQCRRNLTFSSSAETPFSPVPPCSVRLHARRTPHTASLTLLLCSLSQRMLPSALRTLLLDSAPLPLPSPRSRCLPPSPPRPPHSQSCSVRRFSSSSSSVLVWILPCLLSTSAMCQQLPCRQQRLLPCRCGQWQCRQWQREG